jgi:hypothetical protein
MENSQQITLERYSKAYATPEEVKELKILIQNQEPLSTAVSGLICCPLQLLIQTNQPATVYGCISMAKIPVIS